jgi:hypothetical protein
VELARVRDDARIGGEDAVHVGVDLARVGAERGRERDGGRVGPAAPEGRDVVLGRDALEARDEHDLVLVESFVDPGSPHLDDLRLAVNGVRDDACLGAGERDRLQAEV